MAFINFVSLVIMAPAMFYGSCVLYFLSSGFLHRIFRSITTKEYRDILKTLRLSDEFIKHTKIIFWLVYTPLLAIAVVYRTTVLIESELCNFCMIASSISYLMILFFSGYVFPKESKAETNYKKICCELNTITNDYEITHPKNCLGRYYYCIRKYMDEYKKNSRKIYKKYNDNTNFKKIAHELLIKILYDFIIHKNGDERSMTCACNFFSHVAKLSMGKGYIKEKEVAKYITDIKETIRK